nr:CoA-binding protein [Candidatus Bathyarchaeota archaeon]
MIGASSTPGKVGMMLTSTLLSGGFKGEIYPVNPNAREVLGIKAYPNVKSIPEDVDLAVVTVPARPVVSAVRDCAEKG